MSKTEYTQYLGVPATTSKHFAYRVYQTQEDLPIHNDLLRVMVRPGVSKQVMIEHLDRIRDWLLLGDNVQEVRPDTFYLELGKIPRLQVISNGKRGTVKQYKGRYPKGNEELI